MVRVFGWLVLLGRSQAAKDAEILVLRQTRGTVGGRVLGVPRVARPVGAENAVTSRDVGIFTDQASEPITAQNPDACVWRGQMQASGWRCLLQ